MQPVDEFMREFFRARTADIKRELEARTPFRKRFFVADCAWDSRIKSVEQSEAEEVVNIIQSPTSALVVTDKAYGMSRKFRYHLLHTGNQWSIQEVEFECFSCHGASGNVGCPCCAGSGWSHGRSRKVDEPKSNLPEPPPDPRIRF